MTDRIFQGVVLLLIVLNLLFFFFHFQQGNPMPEPEAETKDAIEVKTVMSSRKIVYDPIALPIHIADSQLVNVLSLDPDFLLDVKYATAENFVQEPLYLCGKCYLLHDVAAALMAAHALLKQQGYRFKLFDCYRPYAVQVRMWEKISNPIYVADPKEGSMHNKGLAVDLTIADTTGKELNMGTAYDHFGKEAHWSYRPFLPEAVRSNRELLRMTMTAVGFETINSEWWHYSFDTEARDTIFDVPLPCDTATL